MSLLTPEQVARFVAAYSASMAGDLAVGFVNGVDGMERVAAYTSIRQQLEHDLTDALENLTPPDREAS